MCGAIRPRLAALSPRISFSISPYRLADLGGGGEGVLVSLSLSLSVSPIETLGSASPPSPGAELASPKPYGGLLPRRALEPRLLGFRETT